MPRLTEVSRRPRHPPEGQISEKTAPFAGEGDKGCATQSPDFARRISHPPPAKTMRGLAAGHKRKKPKIFSQKANRNRRNR